jgi:hypothetical protein
LANFLRGTSLKDVEDGVREAGTLRAAWLYDRTSPCLEESGDTRFYKNPMTATGLFHALKSPRFECKKEPDAERRLIYISDLSPAYIQALAATASLGEVEALRSAICQHLAFQNLDHGQSSSGCFWYLPVGTPYTFLYSEEMPLGRREIRGES